MTKWYRNNIVKAILTGIAHVASVVLIIAFLWIMTCPSGITDIFTGNLSESYLETDGFSDAVWCDSISILNNITNQSLFETDGKVDKTKIVDVQAYEDSTIITNENKSGIAYTIDELIEWADAMEKYDCESSYYGDYMDNPIVVCKKPEGTYDYYYFDEFEEMVDNNEIRLITNYEYTEKEVLAYLKDSDIYNDNDYLNSVLDTEGNVKYKACWNYDGCWMEEMYAPQGAENLLDIVNTDSRWNGKLNEAFDLIFQCAFNLRSAFESYEANLDSWEEGDTNLSYIFADITNKTLQTNKAEYSDYEKLDESLQKLSETGKYVFIHPTLSEFETNMEGVDAATWLSEVENYTDSDDFVYAVAVDATLPIPDYFAIQNEAFLSYAPHMTTMMILLIVSAVILIICVVWLTFIAGRKPEDEEIYLCSWDKWKTEIAATIVIGVWVLAVAFLANLWYTENSTWDLVIAGFVGFVTCTAFLIGYLSLVRRIKAKTLWKDSLTRSLWVATKEMINYIVKHVPSLWRTILVFVIFVFLHWAAMSAGYYNGGWVVIAILSEVAALFYVLNTAIARKKIHKGIQRISEGDVDYKISLEHLHGQQLEIAEMVNNIGEGLNAAVEKSMKSERLKTDLITNVSHDIKTPLTSIINYIDLLKRENFTDPKIQGYLDILEAKAQRLKTLTEDVVEASKVSSGNISLEKMNINLVEMIQQTSGEFEEKFKKRGLQEVLNLPEGEAIIHVDGRRMWRVLENIYNNAAKYAMEGTRVYADLKVVGNNVVFSLKNISEQPLNIEADELTERFIRGDVSRSTEGSGLGLSIAKNLTEMQGGKFELYLDGDLFKVTITFPKC